MMNKEELFEKKLELYFHDSPDKPFILLTGKNHEKRAEEVSEKLGISYNRGKAPDVIASSMERYFLPKGAITKEELQVKFGQEPEFAHPLSGKKYDNIEPIDYKIFTKALDLAVEEISNKSFTSYYDKFLYIWRNMHSLLKKHTPAEYKRYWDVAPADTRFPNHTIFDHLDVTTAINAERVDGINLNNMTFFLLTIGPVQEYISQARKTQDLYWGSYILSYLTWKAIEKVAETFGPDSIIFPDLEGQPFCDLWLSQTAEGFNFKEDHMENLKTPTIPNRFFALLPTKNIEDIKGLRLEEVIKAEFERIGDYILNKLLPYNDEQKAIFEKQIKQFPHVYWVALPLENGSLDKADWEVQLDKIEAFMADEEISNIREFLKFINDQGEYPPNIGNIYGLLYSYVEKMMGARKGIRNFQQFEETGRKCSICGEYNAVVYRRTSSEDKLVKKGRSSFKLSLLKEQSAIIIGSRVSKIPYKYLNQGEGLCGACFTKRAAELYFRNILGSSNIEDSFPSTAEIALLDIVNNPDDKLQALLKDFKEASGDSFDWALLYEENLNEKYFEKYNYDVNRLTSLQEKLKKIDRVIKELGLNKRKYYALIKFDGDNMGQWLSGQLAPRILDMYHSKLVNNMPDDLKKVLLNKKRLVTPAVHVAISRALKTYSLNYVKSIVEEDNRGKVIYSGGDDVLALVNLDSLMDVMVGLRAAFSGHIDGKGQPDFTIDGGFVEYEDKIDILMGSMATGSMGVVIAHYKEDLKDVINAANRAEKQAKNTDGKDAFSIHLMLHSGKSYMATAKWAYSSFNNREGTIGILKEINSILNSGVVNISFIKKLQVYLQELDVTMLPEGIFNNELKRSILNSMDDTTAGNNKTEVVDKLYDLLSLLNLELGYENFMNILSILVFLNRRGEI